MISTVSTVEQKLGDDMMVVYKNADSNCFYAVTSERYMSFTQAQPPAVEEDLSTASASEDVSGLVRLLEEDQKE